MPPPWLWVVAALVCVLPAPALGKVAVESATIASVTRAFADGSLTCRQLVDGYLARIAAYDRQGPNLSALLAVQPQARAMAEAMDAAYRRDRAAVGPLHCVPVILKDNYDTADMPTTAGSRALAGSRPRRDAFTVQKLRDAGALILAKANLQELAMGGTTVSSLGGQTRNPYDLTRTPGGSSGGTGAAVAAGFGLVGTGSDTGQSIRSPASANNLVGLRPTRGLVSRRGIVPVSLTQDEAGPITRTVEDAARLLDVMAGVDPEDPVTAAGVGHQPPTYTAFLDRNGLRGARIGVLREYFGSEPVHAEVNRVMAEAIQVLRAQGAHVEDVIVPGLATLTADMATGPFETRTALNRYLASLGPGAPVKDLTALIAGGQYHPAIAGQLKEAEANGDGMAAPAYAAIFVRRDRLRVALLDAMARQRLDAVLYPHQRRLVAAIGDEQLERNGVLSNGTGFPALTLPAGFSSPTASAPLGVPVGLELLGREWSEGTLLRLGYAFEQATSHRTLPASTPPLRSLDIHFTPTRQAIAEAMLDLAGTKAEDVVYDLGSGDGRLVILAAQRHKAQGVGYELQPSLVALSRQSAIDAGVADRVRFVERDLREADLAPATVVLLYLSTSLTRELTPKLLGELRPGARIVSHQFRLADRPPDRSVTVEGAELHLWTVPPR